MIDDSYTPDAILRNLQTAGYDFSEGIRTPHHDAGHAQSSVRRFEHANRVVEIHTHYRIVIDGQEFPDALHVADDGSVHYHGYPQYRSPSAVDVVKRIAEDFLEETPPSVDAKAGA